MKTLTDLYNNAIVPMDQELEKQAAELWKQAEEEDAAGRIMARGFADELNKLAEGPALPSGGFRPSSGGRRGAATETPKGAAGSPSFGRGSSVTPGGNITPPKPKAPPAPKTTGGAAMPGQARGGSMVMKPGSV
jgi:hypothetical protein